ncbi:NfeD family protein [Sinimarinibacterium thermocellulolyticum]|uniref:NfeD family protein n=1 Tax=Sinimarinibacterium thermocellulolyticum TaxID=3170016 RepID=A0ABV2AE61_9GAMM
MTIEFWHWLALGFGLLALEMFLPTGFILLWLGVGAITVGGIAWIVPGMGWAVEFVLWGALSVIAVLAWRKFKPLSFESERPTLNRRGHAYVGRTFTLGEPMVNGVGKLRIDDSQWRIVGSDAPAGTRVRVVEVEGTTLKVEKLD